MASRTEQQTHRDFILSTAKLSSETSTALLHFSAQFQVRQHVIAELALTCGLTAATLQNLAETIDKYGEKIGVEDSLTKPLVAGISSIVERIAKGLEEAVEKHENSGREESKDKGALERVEVGSPRSRTKEITYIDHGAASLEGFGGYRVADELGWRLEQLRGNAHQLEVAVKYLAVGKMEAEYVFLYLGNKFANLFQWFPRSRRVGIS